MTSQQIIDYISTTFQGLNIAATNGDTFFIYDPERNLPPNQQIPFATLITSDAYDQASNLARPDTFRLNLGVAKETYIRLFGPPPKNFATANQHLDTGHDYTALNTLMPHPIYAPMSWLCILNPTKETFNNTIKPLLTEAYNLVAKKHGPKKTS